jgi:hypothetical protein
MAETCWFCGKNEPDPTRAIEVPLFKGTENTKIVVPRCTECSKAHAKVQRIIYFGIAAGLVVISILCVAITNALLPQPNNIAGAFGCIFPLVTIPILFVALIMIPKRHLKSLGIKQESDKKKHPEVLKLLNSGYSNGTYKPSSKPQPTSKPVTRRAATPSHAPSTGVNIMPRSTVMFLWPVEKKDVLNGDLSTVKSLIDNASKILKSSGAVQLINMSISGYDLDPRQLSEIPEVVTWFKMVHKEFPYLPLFLSPSILGPYLICISDAKIIGTKKRSLTINEQKAVDLMAAAAEKAKAGDGEILRNQLEFEALYQIDPVKMMALDLEIDAFAQKFLQALGIHPSVQKRALSGMNERIILFIASLRRG